MASGEVVSRESPGTASLSEGSSRSRRLTASPRERTNPVQPAGPPIEARIRFAAVLSLYSIAAAQRSPKAMPPSWTWAAVTGA